MGLMQIWEIQGQDLAQELDSGPAPTLLLPPSLHLKMPSPHSSHAPPDCQTGQAWPMQTNLSDGVENICNKVVKYEQ